jgi:hypothetical protein
MSEDAAEYGAPRKVHLDKQTAWRIKAEAEALRHVDNLSAEDRTGAIEQLDRATHELVFLMGRAKETWTAKPASRLSDIALCLDDPALDATRAQLEAAGALEIVTCDEKIDPFKAEKSFHDTLQDHEATKEQLRLERAGKLLEQAREAHDHKSRAELSKQAIEELHHRERETELPLGEVWNRHSPTIAGKTDHHAPQEAVMLNTKARRDWASWFNRHLGPRAGLTPGRTLLIGGGPGGGKTSLAAALAVDALAAGCPVTFYQLELGVEETLEHLIAQDPVKTKGNDHHLVRYEDRVGRELPDSWRELLVIPRWAKAQAEAAIESMQAMAQRAKRMRRSGAITHQCNGLFILDYVQLLTLADSQTWRAGHEVIATAVSRLAKAAAECGAVLVLLSQVTKESRKDSQSSDGTEFSGADIERVAHVACTILKGHWDGSTIQRATKDRKSEYVQDDANGKQGHPRLINFVKMRGVWPYQSGLHPESEMGIWYSHRALYGDQMDFADEAHDRDRRTKARQSVMPLKAR